MPVGLIRLRIGIIGEPLRMQHWTSGFHKRWSWSEVKKNGSWRILNRLLVLKMPICSIFYICRIIDQEWLSIWLVCYKTNAIIDWWNKPWHGAFQVVCSQDDGKKQGLIINNKILVIAPCYFPNYYFLLSRNRCECLGRREWQDRPTYSSIC